MLSWISCGALIVLSLAGSVWGLSSVGLDGWITDGKDSELPVLCFRLVVAISATFILVVSLMDPRPFTVSYAVWGRPEIPRVETFFVYRGRWTTFTLWCNTLATLYFWCATAVGALEIFGGAAPLALRVLATAMWEVTLPMAFLVNLVVSFVLIPGIKKAGKFDKLWIILQWRPQALHNGYVIVSAFEAAIASRPLALSHFPIVVLWGMLYVLFAWALYAKRGIFHYFFLDPRFQFAPLAYVGLLALLTGLYCAGSVATAAASAWPVRCGLMLAALGTCTWRDAAAVGPNIMA